MRFAEVPTPAEAIAGGQVVPGPALVAALKELRKKLGGGPREVATAIPANLALVRRLAMPKLPVKKLRSLLETQGQQFIPFYRDGATFDFVVTNPNLSPNELEILLVAVPTVVVERLQAAIRADGLKLVSLDIETVAQYRAGVALGEIQAGAHAAVLDVGHRRARLGLFSNGWPTIIRTMDVLPLLPTYGEPPADVRFLDPEEFAVELRRTVEILLSQSRPDDTVAAMLLSARWESPDVVSLLEEEMRVGGRTAPDFRVALTGGPVVAPGFSMAFGLALALAAPPIRLTLLPRPPMDVVKQRRLAGIILFLSLLGAGAYGWYWYQDDLRLAEERIKLDKAMAEHNTYIAKTEPVVKAVEARAKEFEPLRTALNEKEPWSVFYPHLRSLLPTGVELQNINLSGQNLTLAGKASTPEALAEFVQKLHTSPMVVPPVLHSYAEAAGTFNISAKVQPRRGGSK